MRPYTEKKGMIFDGYPKVSGRRQTQKNEYTGRVIAVYVELTPNGQVTYFDVRGTDDQIYYPHSRKELGDGQYGGGAV